MNALLRRFVDLIEPDLTAAGFVRRGPVFRHLDAAGNGIALDVQPTAAMWGEVEFFVNAGLLLAPHLRFYFGDEDPGREAMPHHSVWDHRLTGMRDHHLFSLSTEADADTAATIVLTWLAASLPRLKSCLGDYDAMFAAIAADGRHADPDGTWHEAVLRLYAHADRGDVAAVRAALGTWHDTGPDSLAAHALHLAEQRRRERES
ncbi:DUF4304 domain-containing protein [Actinoplanes sp. L3-i22]|uniref:DUF4304 domain-containing protein n=1 Tax=Actinoplanes sp. L3-i22 TaxID=2836373 RepID=UPI001C73E76B|nr:DUF4304 domain-containing protein [Actinoplanes sp. L3-i22]BCY10201.1 hypothetical protein L3i22_052890 [Actinoplanes sp. L3-i22]